MGDLRDWSPEPNGVSSRDRSSSSSSNQTGISAEYWRKAEEATQGIIARVQPTVVSEERRKAVIDYVQRLIRNYIGCEVFPFGSVPLKTYLPDGDIDLTAFGGLNLEEAMANDVCSVLEREDHNTAAEFVVKDVQLIRAEVKLVKCLVQNIVVDISFNQLGGLCTLCFLEQLRCLKTVGEIYCLAMIFSGNVWKCSQFHQGDLRLIHGTFPQKHLNIVDPLRENNNLGRSVSKGNFYRIRSAFTYGARKLGQILSQPEESIGDELHKFSQTLWIGMEMGSGLMFKILLHF
ncbi:hypothetical protein GQ457_13G027340 [Hibiscus cannabinus]